MSHDIYKVVLYSTKRVVFKNSVQSAGMNRHEGMMVALSSWVLVVESIRNFEINEQLF